MKQRFSLFVISFFLIMFSSLQGWPMMERSSLDAKEGRASGGRMPEREQGDARGSTDLSREEEHQSISTSSQDIAGEAKHDVTEESERLQSSADLLEWINELKHSIVERHPDIDWNNAERVDSCIEEALLNDNKLGYIAKLKAREGNVDADKKRVENFLEEPNLFSVFLE